MSRILVITIDDDDRADAPDKPYAATTDVDGIDSGVGATVREAILDLLANDLSALDVPGGEA